MRRSIVIVVVALLALAGFVPAASAHPFAIGGTTFHDGVDKRCTLRDANAAALSAPSAAHPWGTVVTGCFRHPDDHTTVAVVREWDLFHATAVREATFPAEPNADQLRVAVGGRRILAVVSAATEDTVEHTMVRVLDAKLAVVGKWDLGSSNFANAAADGNLGALTLEAVPDSLLVTIDLRHARIIGKRRIPLPDGGTMSFFGRPKATVLVDKGRIVVGAPDKTHVRAYVLSKDLRSIAAAYARKQDPTGYVMPYAFFVAPGVHGTVVGYADRVDILRADLTLKKRLGAPPMTYNDFGPARWAIDPATGRVATEDGRIASHVGAPFKRVLDFTREVLIRGPKREVRADDTRAVLWAFGRVVIVRDAPGLGIVAIDPGGSAPNRQRK